MEERKRGSIVHVGKRVKESERVIVRNLLLENVLSLVFLPVFGNQTMRKTTSNLKGTFNLYIIF